MSTIYTDPPQSRNEAIIKSTIDGIQYTDPPQSRMEDLLLELKETIEQGGGGGTTVVANPEGEATDDLEKLQVGNDIYEIPKDYEDLDNKPSINDVELSGNKTASELGLQPTLDGTKTVSGNPITVTDAEPMNAESVVVELEPKQDLHGYDAPWVGGASKNLLPMTVDGIKASNTTGTWSGNVYSIANGTIEILTDDGGNVTGIKANGTFNEQVLFYISGSVENQQSIIFNGVEDGSISTYSINMLINGAFADDVYDGDSSTYTIPASSDYSYLIVLRSGYNASNLMFYPMVRDSSVADPTFAPYSNICPITGYSEVNVERVGKNWFGKPYKGTSETSAGITTTINDDGSVRFQGTSQGDFYWNFKDGDVTLPLDAGTYTISSVNEIPQGMTIYVQDTYLNITNQNRTLTLSEQGNLVCYVHIPQTGNNIDFTAKLQLELGNQATTYEPYQGDTYTVSLGGTKYGGTLDVTEGGYSDEWGYISGSSVSDLVSAGATTGTTGGGLFYISFGDIGTPTSSDASPTRNVLQCNELDNEPANYIWEENTSGITSDNQGYIYFVVKDITTQADMDTWLSNNPIQIAYRKKTPSSVSTTPTDIPLLENTNNISTDGANITLKYQPNNVIGECKAYTDEQCAKVLPPLPTTDGTYHLSCEVTSGVGVLSWVSDS